MSFQGRDSPPGNSQMSNPDLAPTLKNRQRRPTRPWGGVLIVLGFFLLASLALHLGAIILAAIGLLSWKSVFVGPVWMEILTDALTLFLGVLLWIAGRRSINQYVKSLLEWRQDRELQS
jgi:hypothetical protein